MQPQDSEPEPFDTETARRNLEALFPNLLTVGYKITSKRDETHNCIAYAAGDERRKWACPELAKQAGYYWPPDAKPGSGIDELVYAYEAIGFRRCDGDHVEPGFEKVAIYMDSRGRWSHAAKLLPDGAWSSKIGNIEDIRHNSPYAFAGDFGYGDVYCFMKRPVAGTASDESDTSGAEIEAYE